jgi:adenylosuccinate lyase
MDIRYSHPGVTSLWSLPGTYRLWLDIEAEVLKVQRGLEIVPSSMTQPLQDRLLDRPIEVDRISEIEERTKHDMVAFLEWLREPYGKVGRWLHYGLTSSDVVDTAQGLRFKEMRSVALTELGKVVTELTRWCDSDTPILGRTHGRVAEVMTVKARAWHWLTTFATPAAALSRDTGRMSVCKLSGPVGTYAHNPPEIESEVAKALGLRSHGPGASQIASRAPVAAWANSAAELVSACAKIAHDIRLMHLIGEVPVAMEPGQVGSSSMAHKRNPIRAEQIAGMARLARGYALMLQPLDVWLERDISHSSVERVAVPDLWHVVLHTLQQTMRLLKDLRLDEWVINTQIQEAGVEPLVAERTLGFIAEGMGLEEARKVAQDDLAGTLMTQPEDGVRLMKNYPGAHVIL